MNDEIQTTAVRLEHIREKSQSLAQAAMTLKEVADQLRADVEALSLRVDAVEKNNSAVADNLVAAKEVVHKQQVKQNDRLDNLETES